jgi:hypothetical protein
MARLHQENTRQQTTKKKKKRPEQKDATMQNAKYSPLLEFIPKRQKQNRNVKIVFSYA